MNFELHPGQMFRKHLLLKHGTTSLQQGRFAIRSLCNRQGVHLQKRNLSRPVALDDFFVARWDSGHFAKSLPTWGNKTQSNIISFDEHFNSKEISINIIKGVDGCFQLLNVLSPSECDQLIDITENTLGYTEDAPVSLPYSIRHMSNCNWTVDDHICNTIFHRAQPFLPQFITHSPKDKDIINTLNTSTNIQCSGDKMFKLLGLNNRFRFYRYSDGDYFKPHTDGSWPHSKVIDGQLVDDAYGDGRESAMTFLVLLSEDYDGGETVFYNRLTNERVDVRTPKGGVLIFFHGTHDLHLLHEGKLIERGFKYMIRTELIFER